MAIQRPTIDDVASLAGVGRTTVSHVLNNGPNVRADVRGRVHRAVEMLHYKVNIQARSLAGGASRQIALIHASDLDTEPNSYYHSGLELGALRACADHGFQLVTHTVNQTAPSAEQRIVTLIDEGRYVRNYGGRISASYIDQNASGTLGWAIGFAHLDAPSQNRHYKAYNYEIFQGCCNFPATGLPPTDIAMFISPDSADKANFVSGQEFFAYSRLNKRDAAIGILEWQSSDSVHSTLDVYYSKFKQHETMRGAQWFDSPF